MTIAKFVIFYAFFKSKHKKFQEFFTSSEKKSPFRACLYFYAHCPITKAWQVLSYNTVLLVLESVQLMANQIWEFCYRYD